MSSRIVRGKQSPSGVQPCGEVSTKAYTAICYFYDELMPLTRKMVRGPRSSGPLDILVPGPKGIRPHTVLGVLEENKLTAIVGWCSDRCLPQKLRVTVSPVLFALLGRLNALAECVSRPVAEVLFLQPVGAEQVVVGFSYVAVSKSVRRRT